jgi:hypothetical protein
MDNANAGFTPLGLAQNAIPFDINPNQVTGSAPQTHFEQIYDRAVQALNNAVVAFDAAQDVTQELREQQNSLTDLQYAVAVQELAYNDQLIELYGTPYPEDIGPGGAYADGYTGPDLVHYMYVDNPDTNTYYGILDSPTNEYTFKIDAQSLPTNWYTSVFTNWPLTSSFDQTAYTSSNYILLNVAANGFFGKPASWTEERGAIGSIQTAIAAVNAAQDQLRQAGVNAIYDKQSLDYAVLVFNAQNATNQLDLALQQQIANQQIQINNTQTGFAIANTVLSTASSGLNSDISMAGADPELLIIALIDEGVNLGVTTAQAILQMVEAGVVNNYQNNSVVTEQEIATNQNNAGILESLQSLYQLEGQVQVDVVSINQDLVALNGAQANLQALVAQGNRIQQERETFRQHTAAQVQGYTVADSAFLVFQNEDLERYNTLFNLAAEYAYMAANAYDYETGLLNTPAGQAHLNQIISSSALGVVQNGVPQISGTDTGDPGLANALAEMYADWQALQGRLGFNNQPPRQVASAVKSPFNVKRCLIVAIENQVLLEWPLDPIKAKVPQSRGRESRGAPQSGHICEAGQRRADRAQVLLCHFPTCFPLVPGGVMLHVTDKPIGAPDLQTHSFRFSRTRRAISSRSCGVHSGCGPSTASTSIFSNVAASPPNSGGATRSSLATSPPRTSSTGEPACASSKSSSSRAGASFNAMVFTVRL